STFFTRHARSAPSYLARIRWFCLRRWNNQPRINLVLAYFRAIRFRITSVYVVSFAIPWNAFARAEDGARGPAVETSGSVTTGYSAFQDQLALSFVYHGALLGGRIGQRFVWKSSL